MLHLCVHGAGHNWRRMDWIADAAFLGRMLDTAQWFDVLEQAERIGARRMLLLGARLAAWLFGLEVPNAIARAVEADRTGAALAARACLRLAGEDCAAARQSPFYYLRTMDHMRDRARLVWKRVCTPPAWVLRMVPASGRGLAHVLRPIQLLRAHVWTRR